MDYEKIKNLAESNAFGFYVQNANETQVFVSERINNFTFEFVLDIENNIYSSMAATYDQPEEGDFVSEVKDLHELHVYDFRNDDLELSDEQIEELKNIIFNNLKP